MSRPMVPGDADAELATIRAVARSASAGWDEDAEVSAVLRVRAEVHTTPDALRGQSVACWVRATLGAVGTQRTYFWALRAALIRRGMFTVDDSLARRVRTSLRDALRAQNRRIRLYRPN